MFSANVFQHLAQPVAEALVGEVAQVIAPDGSALLYLPVAGSNLPTNYSSVLRGRLVDSALVVVHRARHALGGLPPMRRRVYDTVKVIELLESAGLEGVELVMFRTRPEGPMYQSFFFAQKPTAVQI